MRCTGYSETPWKLNFMNPKLKNAKIKAREVRVNTGNGLGEHACSQAALALPPQLCSRSGPNDRNSLQQVSQPPRSPRGRHLRSAAPVLSRAQLRPHHSPKSPTPPLSVGYGPNDWDCILKPSLRRLYLLSGCTTPTSHTHTHTHTHALSLSQNVSPNTRILLVLLLPLAEG